jgi:4-hydroxy-2-oxoheptanedioate aldolase
MEINKRNLMAAAIGLGAAASTEALAQPRTRDDGEGGGGSGPINSGKQTSSVDPNYKPRRFNKVIELWEDGQPAYYANWGVGPGVDPYEQGRKMCKTYADCISIDMEHGLFDLGVLRDFMRGLGDGGGTKSGHRMPATFVTPPVIGLDEAYMRANSWVVQQIWDAGVMGVHICHARDPKAVRVAAQMCSRYPFATPKTALEGLRGAAPNFAAEVWGMNSNQYVRVADLWPLNPKGELMLGLKIEDTVANAAAAKSLAEPGIAFAEWGPTDNNYWINGLAGLPVDGSRFDRDADPKLDAIRTMVLDLCKKNNVRFLDATSNVVKRIKDGAMIMGGGEAVALTGREFTKRRMPI